METLQDIQYIDTPDALSRLCGGLRGSPWITLDTEFLREKTYYPKLCLLQVATDNVVACVDPLALEDLSPLLEVIYDDRVLKVMHAARQDMEIFYHLQQSLPAPVFDTQIAALLLGYPDQIGYGNLVREVLGISLEKMHARADWTRRPLAPELLRYAADDVVYLAQVYHSLSGRLEELGRLDWLAEDFRNLTDPALYSNPPEQAWLKVRGASRLKGAALSVLQTLATWRETMAVQQDRPRGWILRDDVLADIARQMPATGESLGRIRGVNEGLLKRHGDRLLELIGAAKERSPEPAMKSGFRQRLSPQQEALVDALMAVVRLCGVENALNPAVLASRKDLEQLVLGNAGIDVLHGWRRNLVGVRLQALLDGNSRLGVSGGELQLET